MKFEKELFKGSLVLLIGLNLFNFLGFAFHLSMTRLLSIADYGILATLFSILYFLGIFSESVQTVVTKYSSQEKDLGKLKNIFNRSLRKAFNISLGIFLVYLVIAIPLSYMLKINYFLVAITGMMIFISFLSSVTRGFMQGQKRFYSLSFNLLLDAFIKLILSVGLVLIGWKVYGAMGATVLAGFSAFFLSFFSLKKINSSKEKPANIPEIYNYTKPVFFMLLAVLLFYSLDVIIAKILFDETTAGFYAIASTLAKSVFMATQPISKAMFPLSAEKNGKKKNLLKNAMLILLFCLALAIAAFYFFPELLIRIFAGKYIIQSSSILLSLGIAFSLLSITNLVILHNLSTNKTKNYFIFLAFPAIQIILFFVFSHNLIEFSASLVCSAAIFLCGVIFLLDR